jgi:hypothetical protein
MDNNSEIIGQESYDIKTKDNDSTVEGTDIIEGLTAQDGYGFIIGLLMLITPLAVYSIKNMYDVPYKVFESDFKSVLSSPDYDKRKFTELYDNYKTILTNNKLLNHKWVLMGFLGFSYMAFLVNLEDGNPKEPAKWIIASIVGATLFIFKFIPSIMSFSENVFGYFFLNLFGSINLWLSLQKDSDAKIRLNKLMTIFNVENLGKKFNQIGIYNGESKSTNDEPLFATFNANTENDETLSTYEFFERLSNASIMKRAIGETTILVFTTLITISLFKNYEGFG